MINLLPPEIKKQLLLEQQFKVAVILGITTMIPLACLALILLSLQLRTSSEVNSQNIALEYAKKQYQTSDFLNFQSIILRDNKNLSSLRVFYNTQTYIGDALVNLADLVRPQGLYFTNASLVKDKNKNIKVTLSGFSKSRNDLLVFQKNIQTDVRIQQPLFSPESWVSPQNVTFYLTFNYEPLAK